MTPDQLAALTEIVATIDRRLSGYEQRSINIEKHMAESATATDLIAANTHKLNDLYLSIDSRLDRLEGLLSNYVQAMKARVQQARKTEEAARGLVSEIRKRFPDIAAGED